LSVSVKLCVHPLASVTVTEYIPAHKFDCEATGGKLPDHAYVYVPDPPEGTTVIEPLHNPQVAGELATASVIGATGITFTV
jgi:hypothetical protein